MTSGFSLYFISTTCVRVVIRCCKWPARKIHTLTFYTLVVAFLTSLVWSHSHASSSTSCSCSTLSLPRCRTYLPTCFATSWAAPPMSLLAWTWPTGSTSAPCRSPSRNCESIAYFAALVSPSASGHALQLQQWHPPSSTAAAFGARPASPMDPLCSVPCSTSSAFCWLGSCRSTPTPATIDLGRTLGRLSVHCASHSDCTNCKWRFRSVGSFDQLSVLSTPNWQRLSSSTTGAAPYGVPTWTPPSASSYPAPQRLTLHACMLVGPAHLAASMLAKPPWCGSSRGVGTAFISPAAQFSDFVSISFAHLLTSRQRLAMGSGVVPGRRHSAGSLSSFAPARTSLPSRLAVFMPCHHRRSRSTVCDLAH